tara:strand:- start:742 stop:1008 length:267 start_codon:yes stop_codon:yes gene_type:complete
MDIMAIIETFGVPVAVAIAFGYFIWKQNKYIQDDLTKDINQQFTRLEGIVIQLINQQKKLQLEVKKMSASYDALVKIVTNLLKKDKNG